MYSSAVCEWQCVNGTPFMMMCIDICVAGKGNPKKERGKPVPLARTKLTNGIGRLSGSSFSKPGMDAVELQLPRCNFNGAWLCKDWIW